jgi:hypothetical protein
MDTLSEKLRKLEVFLWKEHEDRLAEISQREAAGKLSAVNAAAERQMSEEMMQQVYENLHSSLCNKRGV